MARIDRSLIDVLDYLRDLGWQDLYLPSLQAAVDQPVPAATNEPEPVASNVASAPDPRTKGLEVLRAEAAGCQRCRLAEHRRQVVMGSGDPSADLMFIGEAPGAEEDRQGVPFVGPAGALLTKIIAAIGLSRDQVYIANVVGCRPPNNRDPQPDEVAACADFLTRQIDRIRPRVIVILGRVAAHALLDTEAPLASLRGRWYALQGVPARVTYHPAALLYQPSYKRPTWEDMKQVRDRLHAGDHA